MRSELRMLRSGMTGIIRRIILPRAGSGPARTWRRGVATVHGVIAALFFIEAAGWLLLVVRLGLTFLV